MGKIALVVFAAWIAGVACWFTNVYQFTQCDFDAPYRCEAIHGAGLFGPIAIVTVWFETDSKGE